MIAKNEKVLCGSNSKKLTRRMPKQYTQQIKYRRGICVPHRDLHRRTDRQTTHNSQYRRGFNVKLLPPPPPLLQCIHSSIYITLNPSINTHSSSRRRRKRWGTFGNEIQTVSKFHWYNYYYHHRSTIIICIITRSLLFVHDHSPIKGYTQEHGN